MTDEDVMPFGIKYKGVAMANVPASYLDWIKRTWTKTDKNRELFKYIYENADAIALELKQENDAKQNEK
jgi:hypothetical protein